MRDQDNTFICGGSLITVIHILTVRQCLEFHKKLTNPKYGGMFVRLGTHYLNESGVRYAIKHLHTAEKVFTMPNSGGDIGIVTVSY